ncbi:MAG: hypothetical protein C5B58_07395 [Acidobacteria bacterium]|nr:MAG: hypothetical protein C5B58_07395 [Acidobacteriota bacterium]
MSISAANLTTLEQAWIGANGDFGLVASFPAMFNISAAETATLCQALYGLSPQQMCVAISARAQSKNWANLTQAARSADAAAYGLLFKTSPPATFGSIDLRPWILTNA